ncbi:calcium/sodium antiporter [Natronoflexus pectinivorans]|uniref:Cation:H+ antiporter n=1 Tax=Natronoflexus pectinivorans TaxID=682526 RepID=A0A4R2GK77_9BACT|nr:calcium/sodium antiporter [Natronoflexus pectinivorans]TCO08875.1 cation:H+ antiporter [Natronoflexus pectinivorans]
MMLHVILLIFGLAITVKGGDWLVAGASGIARRYGFSEMLIGLTIVAFGTSVPEFVVSLLAIIDDHSDIALANVIGSNNFNLLVILGVCGLMMPLSIQKETIRREIPVSLLAVVMLLLFGNDFFISSRTDSVSRLDGIFMLIVFTLFLIYLFHQSKLDRTEDQKTGIIVSKKKGWLLIVSGLGFLLVGGQVSVTSAVNLAKAINISEKVIGLTVLAIGTSLPELVTSIVAMRKKNVNIAIGNIIGSNIFNVLWILGIGSVIMPINFSGSYNIDLLFLVAGTVFLILAMFTGRKRQLDRWESIILLGIYGVWMLLSAGLIKYPILHF